MPYLHHFCGKINLTSFSYLTLAFAVVGGLITGFIMHCVGKTSVIDDEELYDDEYNIDDMEEKHAIPEEILCLIENQVASNGAHESSKLLSTNWDAGQEINLSK